MHSGNADSLSKVLNSVIHEKITTTTNTAFSIFPESSKAFVLECTEVTFGPCTKDRNNVDLLSEVLCMCTKDMKQKFLRSICEAASRIDRNQGTFVKTFRVWWKAWPRPLIAHLQNHLQRKGDVSKRLRKYTMASGLSPLLTRKMTLAWTLKFAVVLWKDWTGRQSSVIGKQHSQLHRIGKGGAQCRMPCDFPLKSGSWIYCINVGIRLLMCSRKLYCVPYFGDFCSWKSTFGVGM